MLQNSQVIELAKRGKNNRVKIENQTEIGMYFVLKGKCLLRFDVYKQRQVKGKALLDGYEQMDNEEGLYHGAQEEPEMELEDGAYTELRSPNKIRDSREGGLNNNEINEINKELGNEDLKPYQGGDDDKSQGITAFKTEVPNVSRLSGKISKQELIDLGLEWEDGL